MKGLDRLWPVIAALLALGLAAVLSAAPASAQQRDRVPIVFVHGSSGSAAQFESQAMRFTSNGYAHDDLHAFEYDTSVPLSANEAEVHAQLDAFIARVKAQTGARRVDVLAHSRGTTVMHGWLTTAARAANVRRYVNFDGRTSATPPGAVRTLAVWGEGDQTRAIGGARNVYFPDQAHTEVTTGAAAFAAVFRFLTGTAPATTQIVPEPPREDTGAGRAVFFPQNAGLEGARVEVYELDPATGHREDERPLAVVILGADGAFGPLAVDGRRYHEFALVRPDRAMHHLYFEPFERDDHFVRLNTTEPNAGVSPYVETGPNHSMVVVIRNREWWGDQPTAAANDRLWLNGRNVLNAAIAPRQRRVIAPYVFDKGSDGVTDLTAALPPFSLVPFLTAADVFLPADPAAGGSHSIVQRARGERRSRGLNVPNFPSSQHRVSVHFKDHAPLRRQGDDG